MAYVADPANPGWMLREGADAAQESSWWKIPDGYVADPNNPGWYYKDGSDVSNDANWVHDPSVAGPWYEPIFQRARETFGLSPYSFGGDRVEGRSEGPWDCVGWVAECFDAAGIDIDPGHTQPYTNAERARQATVPISEAEAQPGDLVFFQGTYQTEGASHIGIVWDPAQHVMADDHDRGNGAGPGLTNWDEPYWRSHLMGFTRVKRPGGT